jgi:hypothetical protein
VSDVFALPVIDRVRSEPGCRDALHALARFGPCGTQLDGNANAGASNDPAAYSRSFLRITYGSYFQVSPQPVAVA